MSQSPFPAPSHEPQTMNKESFDDRPRTKWSATKCTSPTPPIVCSTSRQGPGNAMKVMRTVIKLEGTKKTLPFYESLSSPTPLYSSAGLHNSNEKLCPCLLSGHQRIVFEISYSSLCLSSSMRALPCHIIESFLLRHQQLKIYPHGVLNAILFFAIRSCRPRLPTT